MFERLRHPRALARLLGSAIAAVFAVAVATVAVQEPTARSGASQLPLPPANEQVQRLPSTVTSPAARPPDPLPTPSPVVRPATDTADHLSASWGIDISWPQCAPGALASVKPGFVVVGLNDGRPFTDNPCAAQQLEYAHSRTGVAAYLNIDAPRGGDPTAYGRRVALDGLARAQRLHLRVPVLWLDVEVLNHWADPATNVAVLRGAIAALQAHHRSAGIYSSGPMWQQITGGASISVPVWLATSVTDYRVLPDWCRQGLGGRPATMAQYVGSDGTRLVDVDVLCASSLPDSVRMFAPGRG